MSSPHEAATNWAAAKAALATAKESFDKAQAEYETAEKSEKAAWDALQHLSGREPPSPSMAIAQQGIAAQMAQAQQRQQVWGQPNYHHPLGTNYP